MSNELKSVKVRLAECMSIRSQLENMGILTQPQIKEELTQRFNAYVRNGDSDTFDLKIPRTQTGFQIRLTNKVGKQSGISMVRRPCP